MENINYYDFLNMCRTCMLDIDLKPIQDEKIIEILELITDKTFKTNDNLPQQICGTCIKKISDINTFIIQYKKSEENFNRCLANFQNECPGSTIDRGGEAPIEMYIMEPIEIKEEKIDDDPKTNIDNIIKDMRKEFDVLPNQDPLDNSIKTEEEFETKTIEFKEEETTNKNKCEICVKTFSNRGSLKRHMQLHSHAIHKCPKCPKTFGTIENLTKHERVHLGIKPYTCSVCEKKFADNGQLRRHVRTHTGVKPYHCDTCNKTFGNSSGLVKHKRIHTGLKPYKCGVCAKKFRTSSHLLSHRSTHMETRDFECEICGKVFKTDEYLRKHMKTHLPEKPVKCDVCKKPFSNSSNLGKHMKIHWRENLALWGKT